MTYSLAVSPGRLCGVVTGRFFFFLVACLMAFCGTPVLAQERIVIDWQTKTLVSSPPEVGTPVAAVVIVQDVNDVLYDYQVDIVAVPRAIDDLANLLDGIVPSGAPAAAPDPVCPVAEARSTISNTDGAIEGNEFLTPKADKEGKFKSIPLQGTLSAWEIAVRPLIERVRQLTTQIQTNLSSCQDQIAAKRYLDVEHPQFVRRLAEFDARLARPHTVTVALTVRPDTDYTVTVSERYKGNQTIDGTKSFKFSPASTVLTLSAGVLYTSVEGRTYTARTAPTGQADPASKVVVAVDGKGGRPLVAALLNYQVPKLDTFMGEGGVTISSGPVVAFSSGTKNTSSLGFFAGLSVHLWRRFFITPGMHLAEFADYPVGFTEGATVPANFGDLTPTTRWTKRFAVGITYRTNSLAKIAKAPTVSTPKPKTDTEKPAK